MSATITVRQDSNGRLDHLEIQQKGKRPLKARYSYVENGLSITLEGKEIPSYAELLAIIDHKYSQSSLTLYNPATGKYEAQKTANIYRQVSDVNAAGNTAIWTPAVGRRFRMLGGVITLSKDAACAGAFRIGLYEGGLVVVQFNISSAALVATDNEIVIPIQLGQNGYLAQGINILSLSLSGNLTAGFAACVVWGTEE